MSKTINRNWLSFVVITKGKRWTTGTSWRPEQSNVLYEGCVGSPLSLGGTREVQERPLETPLVRKTSREGPRNSSGLSVEVPRRHLNDRQSSKTDTSRSTGVYRSMIFFLEVPTVVMQCLTRKTLLEWFVTRNGKRKNKI